MAETLTAIGGVAAVVLSIYNVFALRRQRGLSADQTEVDLAKAAIELHRMTTEQELERLRSPIDEKDDRNREVVDQFNRLSDSVSHMVATLSEFLNAVNGTLPVEWRRRLTLLVSDKKDVA